MSSSDHEQETSTEGRTDLTKEVFDKFKVYLDQKLETLATGLTSKTTTRTQKLERQAEGQLLKFPGNKDQFLFNSELQETVEETADLLNQENFRGGLQKLDSIKKTIQQRQKKIKLADKSEAGWLAVKEYEAEELANDSGDEKRIKKAQERALRKKKQDSAKKQKSRTPSSSFQCSNANWRPRDDKLLFRGKYSCALSLFIGVVGKCFHAAYHLHNVYILCFSELEKENVFPSYERSEEEGKCIFLRKKRGMGVLMQINAVHLHV